MIQDKLQLLKQELRGLESAAEHLSFSTERCQTLLSRQNWSAEELERLESLTSRFARLADLVIQRIMRRIDELELTPDGTLLDRVFRAEKRGWIEAQQLIRIRELRNLIAHEYADDKMPEIYTAVARLAPELLTLVPVLINYGAELVSRLERGR